MWILFFRPLQRRKRVSTYYNKRATCSKKVSSIYLALNQRRMELLLLTIKRILFHAKFAYEYNM